MAEWFAPLKGCGHWIWLPRGKDRAGGGVGGMTELRDQTGLFYREIVTPPGTHSVELHVSAEGRYTIWLGDGDDPLGKGPARTDRLHRSLDTYSLEVSAAPEKALHLWAQVRWHAGPPDGALAEMHGPEAAFLAIVLFLDATGRIVGKMGTDRLWQVRGCLGIGGSKMAGLPGYHAVGDFEHQKSSGWPGDWRKAAAPAPEGWAAAVEYLAPYFKRDPDIPFGPANQAWLIEREIAHTEYRPLAIREIRRLLKPEQSAAITRDAVPAHEPVHALAHLKVGPGEDLTLLCDVGEYAIGYYRMRLRGRGTKLAVTSSEVLCGGESPSTADANFSVRKEKSFSLDSPLDLLPFTDSYTLDTPDPVTMEASHWRAFRFLELKLTGGPDGGELETFTLHATGYPLAADYAFDGSAGGAATTDGEVAETVRKMVDVSWRTLKCCTWETYMDCPYYEQLQYIGDTRITALITYLTTGDSTLPVQAIRAFDRSRIYEGLTQSRYPSHGMQIIPTFSLIYILMIEDYLRYTGDEALVAEVRPGIAPILNWFTQFSDHDSGLIGYTPYWPFIDWVNGWEVGIPPHAGKGPGFSGAKYSGMNAGINLFHLLALQSASNIYERTKAGSGNFYASRAAGLKQRIYDTFYDAGRGLMCEVPTEVGRGKLGVWGQQSQALAVLADVLSPTEARHAMRVSLDPKNVFREDETVTDVEGCKAGKYGDRSIAPASIYFRFYVAEALAKLRMGEYVWPMMAPFRSALLRGSTTWPESLEPSRSECHAWSAWPLYFFARHVLGIAPPSLEDGKIRVRPLECSPLSSAQGRFQTHRGPVSVEVSWVDGRREVKAQGLGVEVVGE